MITLIGHGYVGSQIAKKLTNFEWLSHKQTPSKNTSFIINAAGYVGNPNADECEIRRELCLDANVLFPMRLEQTSKVPIIHVSTGCLYDGYSKEWCEDDQPNLNFDNGSFYSGSKGLFQQLVKPYLERSYLFRIRMPFGVEHHNKNLLSKLEKYDKLVDYRNSITCIEDLVDAVLFFAKERPNPGIYNVTNVGSVTTKEIADMLSLEKQWMDETEFYNVVKAKRSNCVLNVDKLSSVFPIATIEESLERTVYNYRKI